MRMKGMNYIGMKGWMIVVIALVLAGGPLNSYSQNVVNIDPDQQHQQMEGIGGALAFYEGWPPEHPNKDEIYQLIFQDLGLDILRLRNRYEWEGQVDFENKISPEIEFVNQAESLSNTDMKYLMCSWSPPANIKANNSNEEDGQETQNKLATQNGDYVYGEYARYWEESLVAYEQAGLTFDWISIQNEPDWSTTNWETCRFSPTEDDTYPGYYTAFDSVYNRVNDLSYKPDMIGPEPLGIGNNNFGYYVNPLQNHSGLDGYAYHLYHGGDDSDPDSFNDALSTIGTDYDARPNIMTEYELFDAGWLNTAWLISNVFTEANASAFVYWDLVWPESGLIDIDNPWDVPNGPNGEQGYAINPHYYAVKHFSKHIFSGDQRIGLTHSDNAVKTSAYQAASGDEISVVLVNTNGSSVTSEINVNGREIVSSNVVQSTSGNYYVDAGSLNSNNEVSLPGNSVTTVEVDLAPQATGWGSFAATASSEHPVLSWMDYGGDMEYYVIERKDDSGNWQKVGRISADGSSRYEWTDYDKDVSKVNYYRIQGVNGQNQKKYSPVLSTADSDGAQLNLTPNPAGGGEWTVQFESSFTGEVELTVFDYQGKQFLQQSFQKTSSTLFVTADQLQKTLAPGVYQVIVSNHLSVWKEKLVITK